MAGKFTKKTPIRVACALIEREGRLLVAQRPPNKALGGRWEFPGGKVEAGERGSAALVREIQEELGVTVAVGRRLTSVTHDYGTFMIKLVPYICTVAEGEPHPHEHTAVRWMKADEIALLDLAEADRPILADYQRIQNPVGRAVDSPWFDMALFATGLAMAWHFSWETRDLVWSLWLASLLVGYTTILTGTLAPVFKSRENLAVRAAVLLGCLFLTAFFTVHFGGFHFVHSIFLNGFFPVMEHPSNEAARSFGIDPMTYVEVLRRYWVFVPLAAFAERANLRKAVQKFDNGAPYLNVVRMHLLIFFFAGAAALQMDTFFVYAIVYATYFFPWRAILETYRQARRRVAAGA